MKEKKLVTILYSLGRNLRYIISQCSPVISEHAISMFTIRQAGSDDYLAIRALIRSTGINPTGLDWHRFIIATDISGELVGCGQVKVHRDGSKELASIAVQPEWRGNGVAREIIDHLIMDHPGTLYLTCRASLGAFYEKFGFRNIDGSDMPPYFRRIHRLAGWLRWLPIMDEAMLVMGRDSHQNQ
jgi:N-acetylglutamate synthase-like GNAT family acetyltransferase